MPYDLKTPRAPRLVGRALRMALEALEGERVGSVLQRGVLMGVGIGTSLDRPVRGYAAHGPAIAPHPHALLPETPVNLRVLAEAPSSVPGRTALDFARAYSAQEATPERVAERFFAAVEQFDRNDPPLRAFVSVDRADVMRQAAQSTKRHARGEPLSVLDGVPVAIKDEIDQLGHVTTAATRAIHIQPTGDAVVVERLRRLGALLVGKTNMHEMGAGGTGLNIQCGTARNPWDPRHHTGGSSSGSGAAVAAGLAPLAVGVDSGGSIRVPAGFCGLVGVKPTWGRTSRRGLLAWAPEFAQAGPMARTARDAALLYAAMAGRDPGDLFTLAQPPIDDTALLNALSARGRCLEGVRIGIFTPWFEDADAAVVALCRAAVKQLGRAGAVVREVELHDLELVRAVLLTLLADSSRVFIEDNEIDKTRLGLDARMGLALGRAVDQATVRKAARHRRAIGESFARMMYDVDLLVTPMAPTAAPPVRIDALAEGEADAEQVARLLRFSMFANVVGAPAFSAPAGFVGRLPVGLQIIGRPWEEALLFRVARVLEEHTQREFGDRAPALCVDLLAGS